MKNPYEISKFRKENDGNLTNHKMRPSLTADTF